MLVLSVILLIIGAAVALLFPHPYAHAVGALIAIVGLILIVIALVPADGHHIHADMLAGAPFYVLLRLYGRVRQGSLDRQTDRRRRHADDQIRFDRMLDDVGRALGC
jgi:hypothetical protein